MGAGKGTATKILKDILYPGSPSFRFSDALREFYSWLRESFLASHTSLSLPEHASTKDLQDLSTKIRGLFGENSLERAIVLRAERCLAPSPIMIIEGIRRPADIGILMHDPQYHFYLVYIEADPRIRWERHRARNEKRGDADLTFERFIELGQAETEMEIRSLRPQAHLVVDNSDSILHMANVLWATFDKLLQEEHTRALDL